MKKHCIKEGEKIKDLGWSRKDVETPIFGSKIQMSVPAAGNLAFLAQCAVRGFFHVCSCTEISTQTRHYGCLEMRQRNIFIRTLQRTETGFQKFPPEIEHLKNSLTINGCPSVIFTACFNFIMLEADL